MHTARGLARFALSAEKRYNAKEDEAGPRRTGGMSIHGNAAARWTQNCRYIGPFCLTDYLPKYGRLWS